MRSSFIGGYVFYVLNRILKVYFPKFRCNLAKIARSTSRGTGLGSSIIFFIIINF